VVVCLSFPEDWWKYPPELNEKSEEHALRDWCLNEEMSSEFYFFKCFIKKSFTLDGFFSFFFWQICSKLQCCKFINKRSLSAKFSLYYSRKLRFSSMGKKLLDNQIQYDHWIHQFYVVWYKHSTIWKQLLKLSYFHHKLHVHRRLGPIIKKFSKSYHKLNKYLIISNEK